MSLSTHLANLHCQQLIYTGLIFFLVSPETPSVGLLRSRVEECCNTRFENSCDEVRNPLRLLTASRCHTAVRANPCPPLCMTSARAVELRSPMWTACETCDCLVERYDSHLRRGRPRDQFPEKYTKIIQTQTTARGFELLRAEPNGFLVHHLNHSVTLSCRIRLCLNLAMREAGLPRDRRK